MNCAFFQGTFTQPATEAGRPSTISLAYADCCSDTSDEGIKYRAFHFVGQPVKLKQLQMSSELAHRKHFDFLNKGT